MTYDPLENLLVSAWKELSQHLPEEASVAALYLNLERTAEEIDKNGNPTADAHRARARLRNAFLVEETNAKSKGKALKAQAKVNDELAKIVGRVAVLLVASRTYAHKIAHIEAHEERQLPVAKSREQHGPESKFALASPFIDRLSGSGVSPSAMGRLTAFMVEFIALLIKAHADDPKLENPDNIWNRIVRSGVLEAYQKNLGEDYLKVVAQAACERDEQTNEWAMKAREKLDLPAGMDDRFLEGVARLRDAVRSLSPGEVEAYYDAYELQDDRDVDRLAQLLHLDNHDDRIGLMAIADFVKRAIAPLKRDWKMEMQFGIMKREIDAIRPHEKWHRDWKSELLERLPVLAEQLAGMESIEAFNALLKSGLAASEADFQFVERLERDVADGHFISLENKVRAACKSGRYFKIYDRDVVYSHEADYELIEAKQMTGHEWLEEFGAWPGDDRDKPDPLDAILHVPVGGSEDESGDTEVEVSGAEDRHTPGNLAGAAETVSVDAPEQNTEDPRTEGLDAPAAKGSAIDAVADADGHNDPDAPIDEFADDFDERDDAEIEDFDWQDENPDLDDLKASIGLQSGAGDALADELAEGTSSPELDEQNTGEPEQIADTSTVAEPTGKLTRPAPYLANCDEEEDDWDE